VTDLIDTTEMYLKTIFELEEEGIVPLRARIAERLHQSGPTVSQTVARMERDGLLTVEGDRHLAFTDSGAKRAMRVMRKHRLAERLLVDVIGLEWEQVHTEACRWEHVMSETVERRLVEVLDHPTQSPYGNPIPGLEELGEVAEDESAGYEGFLVGVRPLSQVALGDREAKLILARIAEPIQTDEALMATLRAAGVLPGHVLTASRGAGGAIDVRAAADPVQVSPEIAGHLFVKTA
jgi:DtxR family Mn-dependent transcriptional regulator